MEVAHQGAAEPGSVLRADAVRLVFGAGAPTVREAVPDRADFVLGANYPNPVKQVTRITYTLGDPADVRIALYDVLGREVGIGADERRRAGRHTAHFDASGLSSGVYFCRMVAEGKAETRMWTVVR